MGTGAWFCDPSAPWQKGSVENLNKRARRYLPRDTPVAALSDRSMKAICDRLNATPRKCLGYRTPAEAFRDELRRLGQTRMSQPTLSLQNVVRFLGLSPTISVEGHRLGSRPTSGPSRRPAFRAGVLSRR
jgi:hypothetical protein